MGLFLEKIVLKVIKSTTPKFKFIKIISFTILKKGIVIFIILKYKLRYYSAFLRLFQIKNTSAKTCAPSKNQTNPAIP